MRTYYLFLLILLFGCQGTVPLSLGQDFYLDYDRNGYMAVVEMNERDKGTAGHVINGEILEINADSNFIIAKIKPVDKIRKSVSQEVSNNLKKLKEEIANSSLQEFWIIEKNTKPRLEYDLEGNTYLSNYKVYGPYTNNEFLNTTKNRGVSKKLKLLPLQEFINS
ncbi:DUF3997 domain-containing protein [Flavobacterium stagni]|uniref:DUF3997 domain-containing protein n=2 Tax=Flavobacterium stagni TaxID=2506421 RepID=A0A4Q1KES0_9FLAO|nr:DUF3997 domain-containing protein [Flavobacterium stagni]